MASHRRRRRVPFRVRVIQDQRRLPQPPQWVAAWRALNALADAGEELTYREVRLLTERAHGFPSPRGNRPRRGW
jgi:hypothetical protein